MKTVRSALALLSVTAACVPEEAPQGDPVTWHRELAPIFAEHCVSCHQEGGIGPFVLDDYATARAWAGPIARAVTERSMPPYLVTNDGTCGTWQGSGWLDDETIATVAAWASGGAVEGEPEGEPPTAPALPTLDRVDLSLTVADYTPVAEDGLFDEYRCFLVHNESEEDVFLTGWEGDPDQAAIVHHMTAYAVAPASMSYLPGTTNAELLAAYDGADGREGWSCFGAAGDGVKHSGIPAVWAPGQGAVRYPDGVGYRLAPDEELVLQVHYNFPDPADIAPDASSIHFSTAETVDRIAWSAAADDFLASFIMASYGLGESEQIPAGEEAWQYSFRYTGAMAIEEGAPGPLEHFELIGAMPHMHELGRRQWVHLDPDGSDTCAMEVQRWDFDWQHVYLLEDPVPLDPSSELEITCEWDSSLRSEPVMPGWGTGQEMCLVTLIFAEPG